MRAQLNRVIYRFRLPLACLAAGVIWIVAETSGGLLMLLLGVRLWRYEIMPIWFGITSPVVWCIAAASIVPSTLLFRR